MTACGFWVVAALSSQTKGLPYTRSRRIGNSWRMACASKPEPSERSSPRWGGRCGASSDVVDVGNAGADVRVEPRGSSVVGDVAAGAGRTAAGGVGPAGEVDDEVGDDVRPRGRARTASGAVGSAIGESL